VPVRMDNERGSGIADVQQRGLFVTHRRIFPISS
jgi:hypothetical protein